MYIKKDGNTLVVGMPRLGNWAATLGIKDPTRLKLVEKLDKEIPEIMISLGAKEVENVNPLKETPAPLAKKDDAKKVEKTAAAEAPAKAEEKKSAAEAAAPKTEKKAESAKDDNNSVIIEIPEVPKPVEALTVVTVGGNAPVTQNESLYKPRAIVLKVSQPPKAVVAVPKTEEQKDAKVGDVNGGEISAYLRGELQSVDDVKKALEGAGFKILSASPIDKKGKLISIAFSNDALVAMANKPGRGFAASLRVLVDEKNKQISITNPLYVASAFMQDDFDQKVVEPILGSIRKAFPGLKNSEDALKFKLLPKYHFMVSMPYYKDMITVAKGDKLLEKAKARNGGKDIVFVQPLSKESTLLGVKLGKRTSKFVKKIGVKNGALLPYPVLIEGGEAKILDPKYYIAVMYPMLKMSEFMTISTVPGAIQLDCENLFR
jgi:hypothetical protein